MPTIKLNNLHVKSIYLSVVQEDCQVSPSEEARILLCSYPCLHNLHISAHS